MIKPYMVIILPFKAAQSPTALAEWLNTCFSDRGLNLVAVDGKNYIFKQA